MSSYVEEVLKDPKVNAPNSREIEAVEEAISMIAAFQKFIPPSLNANPTYLTIPRHNQQELAAIKRNTPLEIMPKWYIDHLYVESHLVKSRADHLLNKFEEIGEENEAVDKSGKIDYDLKRNAGARAAFFITESIVLKQRAEVLNTMSQRFAQYAEITAFPERVSPEPLD